ncbi:ATP-dependent RNA helicase [Desulfonema limicola]|uniref:ATP-dependent RNA helicase n=1 Tax=Desulfonema limicola TaxID=45656 RepID=A0A975B9R8_9BACT|nr:DEAD/DEAH box helicase [Desulfonema limicola]QTA81370.1 ATP-dependent RNA helicase [Desulfonema limicola]
MVLSFINNIRNKLKKLTKSEKKQHEDDSKETVLSSEKKEDQSYQKKKPFVPKKKKNLSKPVNKSAELIKAHDNWDISQFIVPAAEGKTRFHDLDLPGQILHAVADLGFQYCSPVQSEILPITLAGRDASGQAQTGTGKTAAFLITVFAHIIKNPLNKKPSPGTPRVLILAPTRELVIQIAEEARLLSKYFMSNVVTIVGGMDYQKQRKQLIGSIVDIIVATPGRLIDFSEHNDVNLGRVEILVIDEADRMLDMGFIPQVRRIVRAAPHINKRQTLFFSATITGEVERLASQWTKNPLVVEIEPKQVEVASVEQIVYLITTNEKFALLYNIITRQDLKRVIIFCNRRDETHRIADMLKQYDINCAVISGEIAQKKEFAPLKILEQAA